MFRKNFFVLFLQFAVAIFAPTVFAPPADANSAKYFFPTSEHPRVLRERLANRILGDKRVSDLRFYDYYRVIQKKLAEAGDDYLIVGADSDSVNAFAHFGAIIIVMDGMWRFARNEDEFWGVITHEMGHIKQDHFRRQRELSEQLTALSIPLLIGGLLADDPEIKKAVLIGGSGIITSQIYAFSRGLEHEADVYALQRMAAARRNAAATGQVMARLQGAANEYLSTHPASARRAAYLKDRLRDVAQPPLQSGLSFRLLREKLDIKYTLKKTAKKLRRGIVRSSDDDDKKNIARYGLLILANESRDIKLGEEMNAALSEIHHPFVVVERAKHLRLLGKQQAARDLLMQAHQENPQLASIARLLIKQLQQNKKHARAIEVFNKLAPSLKQHPSLLKQIARSHAAKKQRARASLQLSRAAFYEGDLEQAARQLAVGKKLKASVKVALAFSRLDKKIKKELTVLEKLR